MIRLYIAIFVELSVVDGAIMKLSHAEEQTFLKQNLACLICNSSKVQTRDDELKNLNCNMKLIIIGNPDEASTAVPCLLALTCVYVS